ncbi:MAG TPA: DNA-processing protein DprA [Fimbriimonadaceae bacterium]|jgi:DNA processing protein
MFGRLPSEHLLKTHLLSRAERERVAEARLDILPALKEQGVQLLAGEDLPERFRTIPTMPPALYCWGDPSCLQQPTVGIVGTRAATTYGKAVAQKFAESLARAGVTIISGGALGIDAAAHAGALAVGGKTAAVMLSGIERVYPRVHFQLFEQIKANGCLLSQFAAGTTSNREYRPLLRNHTVAGLCNTLVVIEAPDKSGALSTASSANEMGRHVFVVPANIENLNFRGSHALIRDGATLVDHPDQVLEAMGLPSVSAIAASEASPIQEKILAVLSTSPLACEFIVDRTGLDTSVVLSELTMLELEGRIMKDAGGYAKRL